MFKVHIISSNFWCFRFLCISLYTLHIFTYLDTFSYSLCLIFSFSGSDLDSLAVHWTPLDFIVASWPGGKTHKEGGIAATRADKGTCSRCGGGDWPRYVCGSAKLGIWMIWYYDSIHFSCVSPSAVFLWCEEAKSSATLNAPENDRKCQFRFLKTVFGRYSDGILEGLLEGIQVAHCNTFDIHVVLDACRSDFTNAVVSEQSFHDVPWEMHVIDSNSVFAYVFFAQSSGFMIFRLQCFLGCSAQSSFGIDRKIRKGQRAAKTSHAGVCWKRDRQFCSLAGAEPDSAGAPRTVDTGDTCAVLIFLCLVFSFVFLHLAGTDIHITCVWNLFEQTYKGGWQTPRCACLGQRAAVKSLSWQSLNTGFSIDQNLQTSIHCGFDW